jgi:eukaryotic-like serine/threonine-protein kinase
MSAEQSHDDPHLMPHDQPGAVPGQNSAGRTLGRYQPGEAGSDGIVPVRDRLLDRAAQARTVPVAGADALELEARFIARLDHAGAPVVLDFVRGDAGAMLVTRRVAGITLAEAAEQARGPVMPPELASPVMAVQTMLKVCDVVAAVHAQGVVHHALRPACILLGAHGQVVVQDWSAAMAAQSSPATLRYVSTVRVSESVSLDGLHRDIQALGVCLCTALLLRGPQAEGRDPLGPITADERVRLPAQLESIVRQALSSDPGGGYRSVLHLAQDLVRFCEGTAPEAHRPGVMERAEGWIRRHRRPLLAVVALTAATVLAIGMLWGRQVRDWSAWQEVAHEDFSDPTWSQRWIEPPTKHGMFAVKDGRLVSTSDGDALLIFRKRLTTPVAIEYSGEILPGSQPCDLSVQWSEDSGVAEDPARFATQARSYMIQAGAFTNEFCAIYQNPGRRLLAHANRQLEVGRTYHFRVELDGVRMSMQIDGETVLEHVDEFPTQSGWLALYGYFKGKAFDDVRILQRRPGNQSGPLASADLASVEKRYGAASELYARATEGLDDPVLIQQALYRKGLAEWRDGQPERAGRTWSQVSDPALALRVACVKLEGSFRSDGSTPRLTGFEEMYTARPEARPMLHRVWQSVLQQQVEAQRRNPLVIDYFLSMRDKLFPRDESARYLAATTLLALGRSDEVLQKFPEERNACVRAMLALGRSEAALALPYISQDDRRHAYGMRGEYEKVMSLPGLGAPWNIWTMVRMGRAEDALQVELNAAYPVFLHLGRAAELLETVPLSGQAANETLVCLGRLQEAAGDGAAGMPGSGSSVTAMLLLGQVDLAERIGKLPRNAIRCMQAAERGDATACARLRSQLVMPTQLSGSYGWFPSLVVGPFIDWLQGDAGALEEQMRPRLDLLSGVFQRTPWFITRAVLGDTPVDEVLGMPTVSEAKAWHAVAAGMRAEVQGDKVAAQRAYTAFVNLPMQHRLLTMNSPDPDVEWFVAWRLRALAR